MIGLKPFPKMKHSHVQWLGDFPVHWEVRRLKFLLREYESRSVDGTEQLLSVSQYIGISARTKIHSGDEPDTRANSLVGYKRVNPNDLVVNIMLAWNGSMGISRFQGIVSPAYCVYRWKDGVHPWYYHYLLRSAAYRARIKAISRGVVDSRLRLYTDELYSIEALLPPLSEQTEIVRFLDHTDRRIQRYIRTKQKLVELLLEHKQATIHQAVTGQIDVRTAKPYPAYKPLCLGWLEDIPIQWEARRLRNVAHVRVSNVDKHVKKDEKSVPLCNYVDVYKNDFIRRQMDFMYATATNEEIERFRLETDDVLITKDSEAWDDIGVPALVIEPAPDLISGYHLALLRPRSNKLVGAYLLRALQSKGIAYQFHIEAKGVTRYGLSHASIKSLWLPLPPLAEQGAIAGFLDRTAADVASAIANAQRQINLLQEYRTRLIADVVTGNFDVREISVAQNGVGQRDTGEAGCEY